MWAIKHPKDASDTGMTAQVDIRSTNGPRLYNEHDADCLHVAHFTLVLLFVLHYVSPFVLLLLAAAHLNALHCVGSSSKQSCVPSMHGSLGPR